MVVTFNRDRATKVVLVVLGLLTAVTNLNALVTSFLALRPTGGTTAPMFYTILAALGVFLVLAARNPSAYRSLIAYAVWSSVAHGAVMALMAIQLPTKRGDLLVGAALAGLGAALSAAGAKDLLFPSSICSWGRDDAWNRSKEAP